MLHMIIILIVILFILIRLVIPMDNPKKVSNFNSTVSARNNKVSDNIYLLNDKCEIYDMIRHKMDVNYDERIYNLIKEFINENEKYQSLKNYFLRQWVYSSSTDLISFLTYIKTLDYTEDEQCKKTIDKYLSI